MSTDIEPCIGMTFRFEGTEFEVCFADHDSVRYATIAGGRQHFLKKSDWRLRAATGRIVIVHTPLHVDGSNIPTTLATASEDKQRKRVQHYLRGLISTLGWSWPSKTKVLEHVSALAKKLNDAKAPSYSTVCVWRAIALNDGLSDSTGMPAFGERGCKSPYSVEEIAWIKRNVIELLKEKPRLSIADLRKDLVGRRLASSDALFVENAFPSDRTLHRIIATIDPYVIATLRRGRAAADRKFRAAGQAFEASRFLELVFGDGHLLDVLVVPHLENGEIDVALASIEGACYRPHLTRFMDCADRYLFPACISSIPFSTATALEALKSMVVAEPGEPRGIPEKLVLDNGGDYVSDGFKRAIAKLAFLFEYAEGNYPDAKAILERYFRELNRFIHSAPGTTFSNPVDRGDMESERLAILTLPQLASLIAEHEAIFCDDIHSATGRSPKQLALEGAAAIPPRTLQPAEVDHVFRVPRRVVITKGRVKYKKLSWFSHVLSTYEASERQQGRVPWVTLLFNEFDLSDALVELNNEERSVPRVRPSKPRFMKGLSLHEYTLIREEQKKAGHKDLAKLGEDELIRRRYALYERLRQEAESNRRALKKHQRAVEGRARAAAREQPPPATPKLPQPPDADPSPPIPAGSPGATETVNRDQAPENPAAPAAQRRNAQKTPTSAEQTPTAAGATAAPSSQGSLEAFLSLGDIPIIELPTSSRRTGVINK